MKASELKAFEVPTKLTVTTYETKGVAGYAAAYNTHKTGEVEVEVFSCNYEEGVIMGHKMLSAVVGFIRNGKKQFATVRFYDVDGLYIQNRNSVPQSLICE